MRLIGFCEIKELVLIPAQVKIVVHAQSIYGLRRCERENIHVPIRKAKLPAPAIKGSAAACSIIETAKTHLKPFEYLKYILETMPGITRGQYPAPLPRSKEPPRFCRLKKAGGDGGKAEEPAAEAEA